MDYDAIVIGGSYAGLSAATQLARARRRVLVVDAGQRRNRFAAHAHGFLSRDGTPPGEIAAIGQEQLLRYPTVTWRDGTVTDAAAVPGGFRILIGDHAFTTRRIVIASGVTDQLPPIPGLAERWGQQVFHCPYCHGYELQQGQLGLLATVPLAMHLALMLPDWGPTTLFLQGGFEPDAEQLQQLRDRAVAIERTPVLRIEGALDLHLADGRRVTLDGLFVTARVAVTGSIAARLGCEQEEGPLSTTIKVDAMKATSVPGVYACGDVLRMGGSVALSVADGAVAGAATHQSLIFGPH